MENFETYNIEEDFNWSSDDFNPKTLREVYKKSNFDETFLSFIRKDVIKILSPQLVPEPHNLVYDEELIHEKLIGPLEKFICNLNVNATQDDVKIALDNIQKFNQPSKLCRRILKTGDVTFSCNDCGLDGTCVVCIDCFHKSAHKDHNYRMANSDGGGCCDCGDVEAWKQNYACTDHITLNQTNLSLSDFENKQLRSEYIQQDKKNVLDNITLLPKSVTYKYFLVCQASLHYARTLLTWDSYKSLPSYLELETDDESIKRLLVKDSSSKNYFTVLFNDEVHTYDFVINTLVKVIKCTKMTASIMASTVSREGRSLIHNDNFKSCKHIQDMIANVRDGGQSPLKVEVIHGTVLAHQAFALKLIEWIQKMSSLCDAFRILTAYTLLGTYDSIPEKEDLNNDMTLIERIMLTNTKFWKIARVEWNDLFVMTMLTEYSIKEQFARLITRIYPKLMRDFIKDDHDHSVSILTLTTQLYTVPSLICMLIEEENALAIITQTLYDLCTSTKINTMDSFEHRTHTFDMYGLKRAFYIISDLRHLINMEPTKWTEQLRCNVFEAVKIFLNLLNSMQGMDSVRRQLGQHLEYEPDWESGMTLQSRLITLINLLVTYCSLDKEVLISCLKETQQKLLKNINGGYKMITKELFDHQVSCIHYDVSTSSVSIHLPLTRFAAALILELMRVRPCQRIPYDESLVILTEQDDTRQKHSMIHIMEPSLRTEVMIAQFRSGMWRRNGYSLVNQILYFHGALMRKEMFDRDILVLQECAAMCEPNEYMIHLLNKFQLFTWITSETTREPLVGPKAVSFRNDEEILTQTMSLGEEFLQLLLTIVSERYRIGVGIIEEDDVIKNEVIQLLCISPLTRSDLTQKLYVSDNELDCIKAVANLKRSNETSTGKYELKDEYYDRFNPFFYHYSRRHQSNAFDAQIKRKKNLKEPLLCCPPPKPVQLTEQFKNLNELLKCDITLILIGKILKRAMGPPDNSVECSTKAPIRFLASDLQLDQSLHLIGLGLYEQERNPLEFKYIQAAYAKDIFKLLKDCYENAKRSKDLIFWLMKKTNELSDMLRTKHASELDESSLNMLKSINQCFSSALSTCDTTRQDSRKRNSELAAQRRERIMAMMKANQDKFLSTPNAKQLAVETEKNDPPQAKSSSLSMAIKSAQTTMNPSSSTSSSTTCNYIYTKRSGRKIKPPKSISGTSNAILDSNANSATPPPPLEQQQPAITLTITSNEDESMDYDSEFNPENDEEKMESESIDLNDESQFIYEPQETSHLCILCRDEQKIGFEQPTMVLMAYIQRSTVLSKNRSERKIPNYALTPTNQLKHQIISQSSARQTSTTKTSPNLGSSPDMYSFTSDNSWSFDATFMPSDLFFGPHISTCGHVMHYDCWQGFFSAISKRETSRPNRSARHVSFELEKHEILCPLCECISNATIPLLPYYNRFAFRRHIPNRMSTIFSIKPEIILKSSENLSACLHALRGTVDTFKHIRHIKEVSTNISINLEDKYIRLLRPNSVNDVLEELDENDALGLRDFISTIRKDKIQSNTCTKKLLNSISTLAERIHSVGLDLDHSILDTNHARIFMMTSWSISYTVQACERVSRFKGSPLFEDLESSKNLCLSSLIRFACGSMMTHQSDMIQSLLVRKLRYLLINEEHLSSSPCCLDIDAFEMFVSLMILLQKLYSHIDDTNQLDSSITADDEMNQDNQSSSSRITNRSKSESSNSSSFSNYGWTTRAYDHEYFRNILHLMLILDSIQVIISLHNELPNLGSPSSKSSIVSDEPNTSDLDDSGRSNSQSLKSGELQVLHAYYKEMILASGHPNNRMPIIDSEFAVKFKHRLLPFLRSCAIFFFHLSHIQPPDILLKSSAFFEGKNFQQPNMDHVTEEFVDAQQDPNESIKESNLSTTPADYKETIDSQEINAEATDKEFSSICQYLSLPETFNILFKNQEARHLARSWLRHSRVLVLIKSAQSTKDEQPIMQTIKTNASKGTIKRAGSSSSSLNNQSTTSATEITQQHKTELMPVKFIRQPHLVNRLIELPYDYSELVDKVSDFSCPSIKNEDSRTPTMCLICGVMLCSQSYCCQRDLNDLASNYRQILQRQQELRQQQQVTNSGGSASSSSSMTLGGSSNNSDTSTNTLRHFTTNDMDEINLMPAITVAAINFIQNLGTAGANFSHNHQHHNTASTSSASGSGINSTIHQQLVGSCTYHAYECSGGVGVFLRIRNCQILLLSGRSKGCYMPAPYIDDHGETDFGLMRGNPLHLNRQHYEKLQHMWLTHSIPEQISRTLEYSPYASSINWHLH